MNCFRCCLVVFCAVAAVVLNGHAIQAQEKAQEKTKVLLITGFDVMPAHDWRETTRQTADVLLESGKFDVKVCEDIAILESSRLDQYDVIVLNYGFWNEPDPSDQAKTNLLNYVKSGKGLVSLHFSCSSFQDWAEYRELLGRVWVKGVGGHGPRSVFKVNILNRDHPITAGVEDFEIDDELYAKLSGDAEIVVLATAYSDWSEATEPLLFVKHYGEGHVVHNLLGHDTRARETPAFKKLLIQGVAWAAHPHGDE